MNFPDVKIIKVNETTFSRLPKNRKTAPYETALEIARLIIMNYAPNIKSGLEKMLALLFDMNSLWEEYILIRLKQVSGEKGFKVYGQNSKGFWKNISIRPDIVLEKDIEGKKETFIIDTKWKNIDNSETSTHDLRQMYVYNEYWNCSKSMLLFPSNSISVNNIEFTPFSNDKHSCSLGKISVLKDNVLNATIGEEIIEWFEIK